MIENTLLETTFTTQIMYRMKWSALSSKETNVLNLAHILTQSLQVGDIDFREGCYGTDLKEKISSFWNESAVGRKSVVFL